MIVCVVPGTTGQTHKHIVVILQPERELLDVVGTILPALPRNRTTDSARNQRQQNYTTTGGDDQIHRRLPRANVPAQSFRTGRTTMIGAA